MSDPHNPMRPLFVEVPGLGDDVREILGGIVGEAVQRAEPPRPAPMPPNPTLDIVRHLIDLPVLGRKFGYDRAHVRSDSFNDQILVDLRCDLCGVAICADLSYRALLFGHKTPTAQVFDRLDQALREHACRLALGPSGRPARR